MNVEKALLQGNLEVVKQLFTHYVHIPEYYLLLAIQSKCRELVGWLLRRFYFHLERVPTPIEERHEPRYHQFVIEAIFVGSIDVLETVINLHPGSKYDICELHDVLNHVIETENTEMLIFLLQHLHFEHIQLQTKNEEEKNTEEQLDHVDENEIDAMYAADEEEQFPPEEPEEYLIEAHSQDEQQVEQPSFQYKEQEDQDRNYLPRTNLGLQMIADANVNTFSIHERTILNLIHCVLKLGKIDVFRSISNLPFVRITPRMIQDCFAAGQIRMLQYLFDTYEYVFFDGFEQELCEAAASHSLSTLQFACSSLQLHTRAQVPLCFHKLALSAIQGCQPNYFDTVKYIFRLANSQQLQQTTCLDIKTNDKVKNATQQDESICRCYYLVCKYFINRVIDHKDAFFQLDFLYANNVQVQVNTLIDDIGQYVISDEYKYESGEAFFRYYLDTSIERDLFDLIGWCLQHGCQWGVTYFKNIQEYMAEEIAGRYDNIYLLRAYFQHNQSLQPIFYRIVFNEAMKHNSRHVLLWMVMKYHCYISFNQLKKALNMIESGAKNTCFHYGKNYSYVNTPLVLLHPDFQRFMNLYFVPYCNPAIKASTYQFINEQSLLGFSLREYARNDSPSEHLKPFSWLYPNIYQVYQECMANHQKTCNTVHLVLERFLSNDILEFVLFPLID